MSQESIIDSIQLRGHHLLCLRGFRGLGYSSAFVQNMAQIQARLRADPQVMVEVGASPDAICQPCPHLGPQGCCQQDPGSEARAARRDGLALRALKLRPEQNTPWSQVQEQLRRFLSVSDIDEVCQDCQWLPLGYCREGVAALKTAEQKINI